ncbi:MFS transporter, CP family, cyanate transporter [Raineyella antarctica]|uniref:MFS transporter, CP family, cyanate transporter n=1 Tax=Raineyella antarctica TaxID=1577474 RepID=A0A1G6I3E8_9ACTN|nr:MFS transporter [Raineyella antarctica]SDC01004.1 MFS transporter, CP family, cyanate transporter [Raineyella antarctica]
MTQDRDPDRNARAGGLVGPGLALAAVVLMAAALRPGATSVGPVIAELRADLGISATTAGVLTALPGLTFAAIGAVAVALSRRIGLTGGLLVGLVVVVAGLLARTFTGSTVAFLACTLLGLAGMALGNVLVPAWIKRHGGSHVTRLMTAYGVTLLVSAGIGSMVASPIAQHAPGGWRAALGVWGLTAALGLAPWLVLAIRERADLADRAGSPLLPPSGSVLRSPTAVALGVFFGMQALTAYVQFGWLPQVYRDAGLSATSAGALLAMISGIGVIGGFLMPGWVATASNLAPGIWAFGALTIAGWAGLLVAPARVPWLWALLLGCGGWTFTAAIAMITARSRDPHVTARVSGFVQPFGYLLAGIGPLLVGVVYQATGGWTVVLWAMMGVAVVMTLSGLRLARRTYVDDELHDRA